MHTNWIIASVLFALRQLHTKNWRRRRKNYESSHRMNKNGRKRNVKSELNYQRIKNIKVYRLPCSWTFVSVLHWAWMNEKKITTRNENFWNKRKKNSFTTFLILELFFVVLIWRLYIKWIKQNDDEMEEETEENWK
jgi:DMSO/TMAO reductase YedYZ heme-binding membrane subunit